MRSDIIMIGSRLNFRTWRPKKKRWEVLNLVSKRGLEGLLLICGFIIMIAVVGYVFIGLGAIVVPNKDNDTTWQTVIQTNATPATEYKAEASWYK